MFNDKINKNLIKNESKTKSRIKTRNVYNTRNFLNYPTLYVCILQVIKYKCQLLINFFGNGSMFSQIFYCLDFRYNLHKIPKLIFNYKF